MEGAFVMLKKRLAEEGLSLHAGGRARQKNEGGRVRTVLRPSNTPLSS